MGLFDAALDIGASIVGGIFGGGDKSSGGGQAGGIAVPTPPNVMGSMIEHTSQPTERVHNALDRMGRGLSDTIQNKIVDDPTKWAKEWDALLKDKNATK